MALAICRLCSLPLTLSRAQLLGFAQIVHRLWAGQSEIIHGLSKESIRALECFLGFLWSAHGSFMCPSTSHPPGNLFCASHYQVTNVYSLLSWKLKGAKNGRRELRIEECAKIVKNGGDMLRGE